MRRKKIAAVGLSMVAIMAAAGVMSGCSLGSENNGKIQIEMIEYKMEAVSVFEELEEKFNATHDDIELKIDSPNDATTIMKTRFIREDYPDIIGIGGDMNYSNFLDAGLLMDISDYDGLEDVKQVYLDIDKELEFVPMDGVYAMPYAANAAGVLYNKDIFDEYGWEIPTTWDELISLCEDIQAEGLQPFYFGFRDTWTCLAPWNAISVDLAPSDVCAQVNRGETTFTENYRAVAEKTKALLDYAQDDPFAYSYNDACTAFANGESVMYPIGSYAVPQIQSVNPDINIDSFVMPEGETEDENILNSGNDLQFSVLAECENKEAAYEVLRFLQEDENVQMYLDNQNAVPCKEGDFELAPMLDGMKTYIEEGKMADYQDHHYPSEMAVDAMIQTYLLDTGDDATDTFLTRFDTEWERYNRDIIRKVQEYQEEHPDAE